jgi:hypothetical protein
MKYSDLIGKTPEEVGYSAYGIEVDTASIGKKINFMYRMGFIIDNINAADINNKPLAVMISYLTTGEFKREIIAEIPSHVKVDIPFLLMLSGCKTSISLLPPKSEDDAEWSAYSQKLKEVMTVWLSNAHINRMVYPLVGYFEYLVLEANGYVPDSISRDEYMLKRYVDEFPLDRMDLVKEELKIHVYEYFGGFEKFKSFLDTVAIAAQSKADLECQVEIDKIQQSK